MLAFVRGSPRSRKPRSSMLAPHRAGRRKCVDTESLYDFLSDVSAPEVAKRARAPSSRARAPKRQATASTTISGGGCSTTGGADSAFLVAHAGDHRPLQDEDDDYDADE